MSLPHPSSPLPHRSSQSSLQHPPSLLSSANPEPTASESQSEVPEEEEPNPEDGPQEPQPAETPPDFSPYFTLVSTAGGSITHHPTVHYIFSDDTHDSDPITAAALRSLDPLIEPGSPAKDEDGASAKERYVLLDMDTTGVNILSAQSMSPDWAVTSTEIAPAPTWDDQGGEGGLMLKIDGIEVPQSTKAESDERSLEELVDFYEKRMADLRKVVDAGAGIGRMSETNKA